MLPEWEFADPFPIGERTLGDDELANLGEVVIDASQRDAKPASDVRHRRALHDHREEHDDEDDPVDARCALDAADQRKRPEEDRDGTFEAAPRDEEALSAGEALPHQKREYGEWPRDERKDHGEHDPLDPGLGSEIRFGDRQPEGDEHGDLGQDADRRQEALDLALAQYRGVAEQHPRHEDGQEARATGDGGDAVHEPRHREHPDRVQREPCQADAAEDRPCKEGTCDADREPDRHLDRELADDDPETAVVLVSELDNPDHERDSDRVVHARLALEDRPRASTYLPTGEDRERDRGIRRRYRSADEPRLDPAEPEHIASSEGDEPSGEEGPENTEREYGPKRPSKARGPDLEPAVEEDHDEGNRCEVLYLLHGERRLDIGGRRGDERRHDEDQGRVRE